MMQETPNLGLESDPSVAFGKLLAHPEPGEEIVISGMSGKFPLADNVDEFKEKLYNKVDMVTKVPRVHPEMPAGFGLLKDRTRFDTGFFGIHQRHARTLNVLGKITLEKCYECILDAGLNPSDIEGTNTGLFLSYCFSEYEHYFYFKEHVKGGNTILGNQKSAIADAVCSQLKLKGPSIVLDTACSTGGFALDNAVKAIRMGQCNAAIVASANCLLAASVSLQFARLGVLSLVGECRPFDENARGYVRSEASVAFLLQKAKDCNRIYARVLHAKTNCDGFKQQGITYPNGAAQLTLLKEIYYESTVAPTEVSYIEAHGTGTIVGDPEEISSIDEFFSPNRKSPLLVGSVKSSIGHSEPTSLLCGMVKVILAFESNFISPNINYQRPRKNLKGIVNGRLKVVTENTPFPDQNPVAGVSSFGFGGGNAHVILKQNTKPKINNGKPMDDLPRLVCVSGRTDQAVSVLLDDIASKFDVEQMALIYNVFRKPIKNQLYRGYVIATGEGVIQKSVRPCTDRKNLILHFGALCRSPENLLRQILSLTVLVPFKERISQFMQKKTLNIDAVVKSSKFFTDYLTQLALVELLKKLEVSYETLLAHSVGKFFAAYFENSLTLEQVLDCAFVFVGYLENGTKSLTSYRFKRDTLETQKSTILSEFELILQTIKLTNGHSNVHHKTPLPEELYEALFESPDMVVGKLKKQTLVITVGQTITQPKAKKENYLNLTSASDLVTFMKMLGSLYEYGQDLNVQILYPKVSFPVSRNTPMIAPVIKWKHDKKHFIPSYEYTEVEVSAKTVKINLLDEDWASLGGHVIDGRILFPATSYLFLVWTLLADHIGVNFEQMKVTFEDCKFLRACQLSRTNALRLDVMIHKVSGCFEISENCAPVMTGIIKVDHSQRSTKTSNGIVNDFDDEDCLNRKDIYKELRLRGYNYKGKFKSVLKSNQKATLGIIEWLDDWVAFMDNMLQMMILGADTRLLYVPTGIEKVVIDPEEHLKKISQFQNNQAESKPPVNMLVNVHYSSNIVKSGGIEFTGLKTSSISRKKTTALPVLEKYSFVPNSGKLSIESAVRVFMQIALENNCGFKITAVELVDEASKDDAPLIGPIIIDVLGDQPLVHADVKILSSKELDCDVLVENTNLKDVTDATVVVGDDLLFRNSVLTGALGALKNQGYLISRESLSMDVNRVDLNNLDLLNVYETDKEKIVLFRKKSDELHKERVFVNVTSSAPNFEWLKALKAEVLKKARDVVVWCQEEPLNGLIGLVNCIRREPDCQHVRALFIMGNAPPFDPSSSFYQNHLDRGLGMNVLMNGTWGTYRHILLDDIKEVKREHCYADTSIRGDLSSIKWFEGSLCKNTVYSSDLVEVYYSPLNFKDVMTASGKINVDVSTKDRREQQCVQGFEFSGKTLSGKRVMGMLPQGTLATLVKVDPPMLWNVPDSWTLKEAASVPVVYSTCIYALTVIGRIRRGDSILIHSGTGGIGQAAINLCLSMGCTIFVTVGTEEKRNFIRKNFPQINEKCIGNSRDLSFERMVMKQTKGKGVDLVLNSLAEEKLLASVRCLSRNGRFLEIGKFDMAIDNKLKLHALKQGGSYHGAMLDKLFKEPDEAKRKLNVLVQKYIDSGAVKPLSTTVFNKTEIEQAFRFMTTGRHMGKVMVEIRNEDDIIHPLTFKGYPRYFCDPTKTYIICGGLGGFGLELADWLVLRGCQNLVLTSRKGVTTGYQKYRIKIWRSYGCTVKISTKDITTKQGCQALIEESNELGPVRAIFNLAVVLKDAILENQTEESFQTSFKPKAYATQYLDEITRISCPDLRDFVVFSSVSCGRGNAGQTNYGMSNSVMERICERRRSEGYPALAIQWGAIGDVGLVADLQEDHIEIEIGGTLQQSIASCLTVLDVLLRQTEVSIVSSMVVAEKKSTNSSHNIMEVVAGVLGIKDLKSVSIHSTLAELGMDSMSTVEVKQTLEREYNIILSPNEIRGLTLARVKDIHEEEVIDSNNSQAGPIDWAIVLRALLESDEQTSRCITLKTHNSKSTSNLPKVIVFPGIEGVCVLLEKITENLEVQAFGINYLSKFQEDNFPKMAEKLLPAILKLLKPKEPFHILAHSMGTVVALEVASLLEKLGHQGKIVLIDGSPFLMKMLEGLTSVRNRENFALENALRVRLNEEETRKIMEDICKCSTLKEKLNIMISNYKVTEGVTESFISNSITAILKRLQACDYTPTLDKLKSKAWLYKPTLTTLKLDSEDYELGQYFEHPVDVKVFDGNHTSILENKDLAQDVMRQILESGNSNSNNCVV